MRWAMLGLLGAVAVYGATREAQTESATPPPADQRSAPRDYVSGVIGGPHDFSMRGDGSGTACSACHTPHRFEARVAQREATSNRFSPNDPTLALFRVQGQRQVFQPDRYTPGPTSLVCLGCHDGTLASSTVGSAHAMLAGVRAGFDVPDGFVWRDHPIGVPYPSGDRAYRPIGMVPDSVRMPEGRIECVSCHDPHNTSREAAMLVMSNRRSALCLACHIK
jgi:predicted CXXCH cytochrome family protein